jgi:hypothetical protein
MGLDRCLRRVTGTELHPMCGKRSPRAAGRVSWPCGASSGETAWLRDSCLRLSRCAPQDSWPPNLWIKSPLLCSFILLELLSNNASPYRELPFCPVTCIRDALRIPGGAGPYRGIRANMEQTLDSIGLDHHGGASLETAERL